MHRPSTTIKYKNNIYFAGIKYLVNLCELEFYGITRKKKSNKINYCRKYLFPN